MKTEKSESLSTPRTHSKKFQRTSTGCFSCRKKKKKCDGAKPVCLRCSKSSMTCEYPQLRFYQCKADQESNTQLAETELKSYTNGLSTEAIFADGINAPLIATSQTGITKMSSKPTIITLNMRASKRKSFTEKQSIIPIKKSEIDNTYLNSIPVSYVRRLISSSTEELQEYREEMSKIINIILEKSSMRYFKDTELFSLNLALPKYQTNEGRFPRLKENEKAYIQLALSQQKVLPKSVIDIIVSFIDFDNSDNSIIQSLNLWCCLYIHFCCASLSKKFKSETFEKNGAEILAKLLNHHQFSDESYEVQFVSLSMVMFSLVLVPSKKPLWHDILISIKYLIDTNGGTPRLCADRQLKTILSYILFIDLTSSYSSYTGTHFSQTDFQIVFETPVRIPVTDDSNFFNDNSQLIKLYYDISRLSSLVNVADDEIDLKSILLEAEYLEKQLDFISLDVSAIKAEEIKTEKLRIFNFYKDVGHLYILQCIHRRQSLSIETMLVARKLLSQVPKIVTSKYSSSFCSFPLFILSIDVATFETRSWMIHQLCYMWELTEKPNVVMLINLLKDIWMVNPDGFKFVFWPEVIAKNQLIASLS